MYTDWLSSQIHTTTKDGYGMKREKEKASPRMLWELAAKRERQRLSLEKCRGSPSPWNVPSRFSHFRPCAHTSHLTISLSLSLLVFIPEKCSLQVGRPQKNNIQRWSSLPNPLHKDVHHLDTSVESLPPSFCFHSLYTSLLHPPSRKHPDRSYYSHSPPTPTSRRTFGAIWDPRPFYYKIGRTIGCTIDGRRRPTCTVPRLPEPTGYNSSLTRP